MSNPKEIKEFFEDVASNCKFRDVENVKDVYYGLVRTILAECLDGSGKIILPAFGEMELKERKPKKIRNVNTGEISMVRPHSILKFNMASRLKTFLRIKRDN